MEKHLKDNFELSDQNTKEAQHKATTLPDANCSYITASQLCPIL